MQFSVMRIIHDILRGAISKGSIMITYFTDFDTRDIGENIEAFLKKLEGPSYIILNGEDNTRTRFFVTLLHGNEPSGVMALYHWLKGNLTPAVRIVCIIAAVKTALQPPLFHYRHLPDQRDLNRCFKPPFDDKQGQLAKAILDIITYYKPEAVIDMHNTSGSGPAFGVAIQQNKNHEALTSLFSKTLIITHLKLGALMDISEDYFPTVTIEVGGRLDQTAHDTAQQGLHYFFTQKDILNEAKHNQKMELLIEPVRIKLTSGASLSYAETPNTEFDVTLKHNIDKLNFKTITPNTQLGWVNHNGLENFIIQDCKHKTTIKDWLKIEGKKLYPTGNMTIFMITPNPVIAIADCLFYMVKPPH